MVDNRVAEEQIPRDYRQGANELPAAGPNVFVEITSQCNHSCPACPQAHLARPRADMDQETYAVLIKRIEEFAAAGGEPGGEPGGELLEVTFSLYGEPLLHPNILEYLDCLTPLKVRVFIETNGELLDERMSRAIVANPVVDSIIIGLDATTVETYEKVRPGGIFSLVQENIARLLTCRKDARGERPLVGVSFLRMKENDHELLDFYTHWRSKVDHAMILGHNDYSGHLPDRKAADFTPLRRTACRRIRSSLTILQNGTYVLCPQDYEGETGTSNVRDLSFTEAFERKQIEKVLAHQRKGEFDILPFCEQCDKWYLPL